MEIKKFDTGLIDSNIYLIKEGDRGILIDAGAPTTRIDIEGVAIEKIILTHCHFDHIYSMEQLKAATGAEVCIHELDAKNITDSLRNGSAFFGENITASEADILLKDGDVIQFGEKQISIIHCPGHSPGGIAIKIGNHLFTGDTLFAGGFGRYDFPDADGAQLRKSIDRLIAENDKGTIVHPGHGSDTTIGAEAAANPYKEYLV